MIPIRPPPQVSNLTKQWVEYMVAIQPIEKDGVTVDFCVEFVQPRESEVPEEVRKRLRREFPARSAR